MAETPGDTNDIDQITDLLSNIWEAEVIGIQEASVTKLNGDRGLSKGE